MRFSWTPWASFARSALGKGRSLTRSTFWSAIETRRSERDRPALILGLLLGVGDTRDLGAGCVQEGDDAAVVAQGTRFDYRHLEGFACGEWSGGDGALLLGLVGDLPAGQVYGVGGGVE